MPLPAVREVEQNQVWRWIHTCARITTEGNFSRSLFGRWVPVSFPRRRIDPIDTGFLQNGMNVLGTSERQHRVVELSSSGALHLVRLEMCVRDPEERRVYRIPFPASDHVPYNRICFDSRRVGIDISHHRCGPPRMLSE